MDGFEDVNARGKARRTGGGFLDGAKICNAIGQPPSLLRPYGGLLACRCRREFGKL